MDQLKTGDLLSQRYEVQGLFLICRFSTLYHAIDRATGVPTVIRMLRLPPAGNEQRRNDMRVQIEREGATLAQLRHPNLPAVLSVEHDGDKTYLTLEHFEGHTLDVHLKAVGSIGLTEVENILRSFLHVLEYLHSQDPPIIHRDLRPHSVVLADNGVLKIAEFGLARITEPGESTSTLFRSEGNAQYASPEQLLRAPSIPANDIYSLGCIIYFLLTHEHPPKSMERATAESPLRGVREFRPDVPEAFEAIVTRMMEPSKSKRYATVQEVTADFESAFPQGL